MRYTNRFLRALGDWQNGWQEKKDKRLPITKELLTSISEMSPDKLPLTDPIPHCYRKRYLVPNNPQNGGDFQKLILEGSIEEGISSWTTRQELAQEFKCLFRNGCVTAIFEHSPRHNEVVVDLSALWSDLDFAQALASYTNNGGDYAVALNNVKYKQFEIIIDARLLASEAIDFVGFVGEENIFSTQ